MLQGWKWVSYVGKVRGVQRGVRSFVCVCVRA